MTSTEGSRELKAARERLLAAEKQSSSAAKAYDAAKGVEEAAKKSRQAAKNQYDQSKNEVKEAKKRLKDAETRWEVLDVETDSELWDTEPSTKKQKTQIVEAVEVRGCEIEEVNGIYELRHGLWHNRFHRDGKWKGEDAHYEIIYYSAEWNLSVHTARHGNRFLYQCKVSYSSLPPKDGWKVQASEVSCFGLNNCSNSLQVHPWHG